MQSNFGCTIKDLTTMKATTTTLSSFLNIVLDKYIYYVLVNRDHKQLQNTHNCENSINHISEVYTA